MKKCSPVETALQYASKGMFVFPCWPGAKTPIPERGLLEATLDTEQIKNWWKDYPNANVAISCGPSGVVVIDIDPRHQGDLSFEALREELGKETFETKSQITPGGGAHYFFRAPEDEPVQNSDGRTNGLGSGIDVRASGGYVLVPPSVNKENGREYVWEISSTSAPLAELPKVLADRLRPKQRSFEAADAVIEGGRNAHLTSMAGALRRKGLSAKEIHAAISVANTDRCKPPLSKKEVERIAESVSRYVPSDPIRSNIRSVGTTSVSVGEALDAPEEEVDWLTEGLLARGHIGLLCARPKVGKSVTARNWALAIARGDKFLGRNCERGLVLWLALEERKDDVLSAFRALGVKRTDLLRFHFGTAPLDAMDWLNRECAAHNPVLVVIDTWHKLTRCDNLNDYAAVNRVNEPLMRLREKGIAQIWVHHNNKTDRTGGDEVLGSSALFAAVDSLMLMKKDMGGLRSITTVQRVGVDIEEPLAISMDAKSGKITSSGSLYEIQLDAAKKSVLEAMGADDMTKSDILFACDGNRSLLDAALANLVKDGLVMRTNQGNRRLYKKIANAVYERFTPQTNESVIEPIITTPSDDPIADDLLGYGAERLGYL